MMPAMKKPGEQEAMKSQKAFSTACCQLNIIPCRKRSNVHNKWKSIGARSGEYDG